MFPEFEIIWYNQWWWYKLTILHLYSKMIARNMNFYITFPFHSSFKNLTTFSASSSPWVSCRKCPAPSTTTCLAWGMRFRNSFSDPRVIGSLQKRVNIKRIELLCFYLSLNITRTGFFQVFRQFLADSKWAVTGSALNIGTSRGHLAAPPLYRRDGNGAP